MGHKAHIFRALLVLWISYATPELNTVLASSSTKPRSIKFDKINRNPLNLPRHLRNRNIKRSATARQSLDNEDFLYYANVSLGTPPQNLRLQLDTGSSDIWVESADSDLCKESDNPCEITGTFNGKVSSTYERVSGDFQISYVDGEYAQGDYGRDVFQLEDGVQVSGLQFGIGLESTSSEGILGIGFPQNQVQVQRLGKSPYPGLTDLMVEQKIIKSRAYSLWLNDLSASSGEVLFGGVDVAKFKGKLATIPLNKRRGDSHAREFVITLTSVGLTNRNGESLTLTNDNFAIPVLLDTGTTYTYLPTDLFSEICNQVGAHVNPRTGVPIVPCDVGGYNGTINYSFSGASIEVPLNELVVNAFAFDGIPATYHDGTPLCYFGIMDSGEESNVLGDTFLRSAYIVFDLENEEISIGKTLYNASDSNILEIGIGKNAVPDALGATNAVTATPTATDDKSHHLFPYVTDDLTLEPTFSPSPRAKSLASGLNFDISWIGLTMCLLCTVCVISI